MSFQTIRYTPEHRGALVALLAQVGTTQLSDEEFAWWFERNPAGEGIVSLAVDEGEVVGVAAMSFFRTRLNGVETRLAIPVNVATDPRYRGQGVFSTLERENEGGGSHRCAAHGDLPNGASYLIFMSRLGGSTSRLTLGETLRAGRGQYASAGRGAGGLRARDECRDRFTGSVRPSSVRRDLTGSVAALRRGTAPFRRDAGTWRYLDSPRDYRCFAAYREGALEGVAVVGHTFKHGVSAGFLADLVVAPGGRNELRALLGRAVDEVRGGADALVLLPPPGRSVRRALVASGFAPTNKRLRFIGKTLRDDARLDERGATWHFTLGDFDFF
jgi:GNAT superfamily N-acetyltransferase